MINKLIQEQLNKVKEANLENFKENNYNFIIPQKKEIKIEIDHYYIIQILRDNDIVKNNWNEGKYPTEKYYKADVTQIMSKMIKVNAIAYDPLTDKNLNIIFSGWLKLSDISIQKEIE